MALSHQVEAIRRAMERVLTDEPIGEGGAEFDAESASGAIMRLRSLLESSDADAAEAFLSVERTLTGTVARSQLNASAQRSRISIF